MGGNPNLTPVAGNLLYAGRKTTYKHWRCTLMQNDSLDDVVIKGINVHTAAGVQSVIDIGAYDLTSDPGADVTFWCHDCACGQPFSGITHAGAGGATNPYDKMAPGLRPTIIGGSGLNN